MPLLQFLVWEQLIKCTLQLPLRRLIAGTTIQAGLSTPLSTGTAVETYSSMTARSTA